MSDSLRHADCLMVRDLLAGPLQQPEAAATWAQQCAQKFQWSAAFGGAKRVPLDVPASADDKGAAVLTNGIGSLKLEKK